MRDNSTTRIVLQCPKGQIRRAAASIPVHRNRCFNCRCCARPSPRRCSTLKGPELTIPLKGLSVATNLALSIISQITNNK